MGREAETPRKLRVQATQPAGVPELMCDKCSGFCAGLLPCQGHLRCSPVAWTRVECLRELLVVNQGPDFCGSEGSVQGDEIRLPKCPGRFHGES